MNITLTGDKEDYKIYAEHGVGSLQIDGKEQNNSTIYGNGENTIKLERWNRKN